MPDLRVVDSEQDITGYHIVEGLPGKGLVAKIATDYIVEKLEMSPYAEIYSRELPQAAIFERNSEQLRQKFENRSGDWSRSRGPGNAKDTGY
ncbi:MAG: PAC2 family protein [Candidatus Nanohaloarchaea archaeon]